MSFSSSIRGVCRITQREIPAEEKIKAYAIR
jgi:hypothetical protein